MAYLGLDMSQVHAGTQQAQQAVNSVNKNIDASRLKLMTLWSYSNQIANMVMRQAAARAKGTAAEAGVNTLIAGMRIAQTEVAIAQTIAQAMARWAVQDYFGFGLLMTIAGGMQANLITMELQKAEAKRAEVMAKAIAAQIEAYSQ